MMFSHEVLPQMYEYERASTTVANGVIYPRVDSYVSVLEAKFGEAVDFKILRSDGGVTSKSTACQYRLPSPAMAATEASCAAPSSITAFSRQDMAPRTDRTTGSSLGNLVEAAAPL